MHTFPKQYSQAWEMSDFGFEWFYWSLSDFICYRRLGSCVESGYWLYIWLVHDLNLSVFLTMPWWMLKSERELIWCSLLRLISDKEDGHDECCASLFRVPMAWIVTGFDTILRKRCFRGRWQIQPQEWSIMKSCELDQSSYWFFTAASSFTG